MPNWKHLRTSSEQKMSQDIVIVSLIVTQLVFPEQGCSDVKVSGVRVGIDRIANLGHYVTVTLPHCVWVAAVHPGRVFGK